MYWPLFAEQTPSAVSMSFPDTALAFIRRRIAFAPDTALTRLDRESHGGLDEDVVQAWEAGQKVDSEAIPNGGLAIIRYHQVRLSGGHDHTNIKHQFREHS